MNRVDHIGIAVSSIEHVLPFYEQTLGLKLLKMEEVASQGVKVAFIDGGNIKLELLEPLHKESPVAKFIEKRGEGIHHVAFGVQDIKDRLAELKEKGVKMINESPKQGAGGAMVAFMHPKSSHGVLYELCDKSNTKEDLA
ncbi:methylmalonyl-CoA epimerase [[Bacillus] enclensis]|uniref:Methylmalonyl-CoA epimerase n=1 Tax=[Bacillus] enclensis TaxID=1402860 RepID=A0A0V8HN99_9BACI|nr:methylmalonyl-CoA epimerase [[Bacillus] enclensis]KSU63568.1 methylmalonyl-CoA epimerase [[Bacillus] enclensis]SCB86156.1 methylmalonyl-CoA epimerase [[Bacillus] enclensis]